LASGAIRAFSLLWVLCGFTQGVDAYAGEPRAFTDLELNEWLTGHPRGLIFVISEGMPYSVRNLSELKASAREHALPLLVLSDHCTANQSTAPQSPAAPNAPSCTPLASETLIRQGALRHFPSLFFNRNHRLLPKVIPGFQTREELERALKENLYEAPDDSL
jgi:hypothetical protein